MEWKLKARRKRKKNEEHFFDYTLLFIVLFLLGFGLVMLYSTSSYEASLNLNDGGYYLKRQAGATALGLVAMVVVSLIPYRFWERFAMFGYVANNHCDFFGKVSPRIFFRRCHKMV
jgi:cell division protein FtsW